MRDRRGPLAALLLAAGYVAAALWLQLLLANALGGSVRFRPSPLLATLLSVNAVLLGWRVAMRMLFTSLAYGPLEGLRSVPRLIVANWIAILAAKRALAVHRRGGATEWDKTAHRFPLESSR
jgi:adsorption protein B